MNKQGIFAILIVFIVAIVALIAFLSFNFEGEGKEEIKIDVTDVTTNPFLWKIGDDNPSYLYGSIHLADKRVLTLPDVVVDAIQEVDFIYTETRLDTDAILESTQLSLLSGGQTIDDLLPDDVYNKLDTYLESKQMSISSFSRLKLWAVSSSLVLLDEMDDLVQNYPLDQYIWVLAGNKGKQTDGIETIQEQISILDSFTTQEQIILLNDTIDELLEYENMNKSITSVMLDAYLDGDLEILQDTALSGFDENNSIDIKYKQRVIVDRNLNISQRISDLIENNPDIQYFFTIGSGHFYGEDGLLLLLENQGFNLSRVNFSECSSCDSGEARIKNRCYEPYSLE